MALKNTVEGFDSNQDDWMSQELKREARISAWDLDDNAGYLDEEHRRYCEAKELRRQHEQNCDAEQLREQHARIHQASRPAGRPKTAANAGVQVAAVLFMVIFVFMLVMFVFIFANIMFRF